jgi:DNA-binding MarR family transcriptional regulator
MKDVSPERLEAIRSRQKSSAAVRDAMRKLRIQMSLLNYRVGDQLALNDVDLNCFDIVDAFGPLSPSQLARLSGLHPATLTGILDRLERGGWIVRERDPADRRAILIHSHAERYADLLGKYSGISRQMNKLLAGYSDGQLEVIAGFLERTLDAFREETDQLGETER